MGFRVVACATIAVLALGLFAGRGAATDNGSAISVTPPGYRDWELISVAILGSPNNDIRAILGNEVAIDAFRRRKIPFPNGAIVARLAWKQVKDPEGNEALSHEPLSAGAVATLLSGTFVAGSPANVQFMIKDSTRFASSGGWGFAQFTNGKPDAIAQRSCFSCHALAGNRGFVFTRYSP